MPNDLSRTNRAVEVVVIEARPRVGKSFGSAADSGTYEGDKREKSEREKALHSCCVCKTRTTPDKLFFEAFSPFFLITVFEALQSKILRT